MPVPIRDHPPGDDLFTPTGPGAVPGDSGEIVTNSLNNAFKGVIHRLRLYAPYGFPLVLEGESGTGKSVLARQVHAWSARAEGPFEDLSLANLSDSLAASELFGHAKGAFTGATSERKGAFRLANRGTMFLDEIGHASLELQAKLLEITERGRVRPLGSDRVIPLDVRVLFATSELTKDLEASGRLLADLYARLRMWRVRIPSLRERAEDIPMLAGYFLEQHAKAMRLERSPQLSAEAWGVLCRAEWPGNIRQLGQAIGVLLVHASGARRITPEHFFGDPLAEILESAQRRRRYGPEEICRAYQTHGKIKRTATILGVSPNTVRAHVAGRSKGAELEVPLAMTEDKD
jgi:DNA-binding NtrC family response regulator